METAFGWLGELISWLAAWFPRLLIIDANYRGIAFVRGKHIKEMGPGLHIYWPLVTHVQLAPVARQVVNLANQVLVTRDNITVLCSGVVVFTIVDVKKYVVENFDTSESIVEVALSSIRDVVLTKTFKEIQNGRTIAVETLSDLDQELTDECRDTLESFGIEVVSAKLNDFAPAKVLFIVNNQISDTAAILS